MRTGNAVIETPRRLPDFSRCLLPDVLKLPGWSWREKGDEKDRRTSHLIYYLDVSLDVSEGDVFGAEELKNLFFGFSIHHRSGIFASANLYGNVYGGSNVNTLYLEWEFD